MNHELKPPSPYLEDSDADTNRTALTHTCGWDYVVAIGVALALSSGIVLFAGCAATIPLPTCKIPVYNPNLSTSSSGHLLYHFEVSRDEVPCLQRLHDTWYGTPLTARILIYREETGTLNYFVIDKQWETP